ncbi:uncharacterized protein K460DRAFT_288782 [Cucurbitaria berberidis CBS 394.84]|uniref:Yeast cell wall synthesis Kre9/Knh1-like N-terminal domain-containing protein n=1 Tax=Cucurbitaria berberidis CBS 394.84 TaxID=1168544 RepID=A0A9P4GCI7_9PLEO|nr:uncharacterized protein K460DRAFT_288782 [Cucurbitaria berberidis CBS 394.84]KAF1842695.1 hypothetical protein K460DRAFT_288782 [Cucurbitaria berberidis CBS 394.84]
MRFFETVISGAALIAAVLALEINDFPKDGVVAGQTYTITYSPKDNTPTTFILRKGAETNLNTVDTLTTTATGGSFSWTAPKTLPAGSDYALQVKQGDVVNYSAQFPISGGSGTVSSAVSSARASASSAASSVASSASAAISSAASSAQSAAASLSSAGSNTTVASATLSHSGSSHASESSKPTGSKASSSPSSSRTSGAPQSTGAASSLATSPLASIFGAIAAFVYLA